MDSSGAASTTGLSLKEIQKLCHQRIFETPEDIVHFFQTNRQGGVQEQRIRSALRQALQKQQQQQQQQQQLTSIIHSMGFNDDAISFLRSEGLDDHQIISFAYEFENTFTDEDIDFVIHFDPRINTKTYFIQVVFRNGIKSVKQTVDKNKAAVDKIHQETRIPRKHILKVLKLGVRIPETIKSTYKILQSPLSAGKPLGKERKTSSKTKPTSKKQQHQQQQQQQKQLKSALDHDTLAFLKENSLIGYDIMEYLKGKPQNHQKKISTLIQEFLTAPPEIRQTLVKEFRGFINRRKYGGGGGGGGGGVGQQKKGYTHRSTVA